MSGFGPKADTRQLTFSMKLNVRFLLQSGRSGRAKRHVERETGYVETFFLEVGSPRDCLVSVKGGQKNSNALLGELPADLEADSFRTAAARHERYASSVAHPDPIFRSATNSRPDYSSVPCTRRKRLPFPAVDQTSGFLRFQNAHTSPTNIAGD